MESKDSNDYEDRMYSPVMFCELNRKLAVELQISPRNLINNRFI